MTNELLTSIISPPDDWPILIPIDEPQLPRLDCMHLPAWAGEFATALSAETETPAELVVGMILVTCATAATRRLRLQVRGNYCEPCNLWVVAALPPGNRKSAVQAAATAPLIDWECDQAVIMEPEIKRITSERKFLELRVREIRNKAAKEKDLTQAKIIAQEATTIEAELLDTPKAPQIWTSDSTPERLAMLLAENDERMGWLSSEGGIFDLLQGRYSNGILNLDLVLKAYTGDIERVDRSSRPTVSLKKPLLSIGLSPQPEVLRGLTAKPVLRGRGLLGRFLYLLPPSPLGFRTLEPNPMSDGVRNAYHAGVRAMLDWEPAVDDKGNPSVHIIRLSDEAYAEYHAFAKIMEPKMRPGGELEHFTDWTGKAAGTAARIAGVLHGIKHAHGRPWDAMVTAETMNSALEIMSVITHHSLAALDMMGADSNLTNARIAWQWIERNRLDGFRVRDMFNGLRRSFTKVAKLNDALDILEEHGYLRVIALPRNGAGRPPSPEVRIRPDIKETWR